MPKPSRSHLHRGAAFHRSGNLTAAADAYQQHIADRPEDKLGHYHLALALQARGRPEAAMQAYAKAIEIDPYYPEALNNLGILLHSEGKLDAARICYSRALASRPTYSDAEYNYATVESDAGNYQAALLHFSRVLEQQPTRVDAWNNLSTVFLALREPGEAKRACDVALAIKPGFADARWNKSVATLTLGQLPEGWDGFEHRGPRRHGSIPRWRGEPLQDKRIMLHAEQGMGDTIQFVRYCSQVQCDYMILECHSELIPLFRTLHSAPELVAFGQPLPSVDFHQPLMSLPELFQTDLQSIPATPYLHAEGDLVKKWKQRINAPVRSRKVGLIWSGNPQHRNDKNRSIDPALLSCLADVPDTSFYCLQQRPFSAAAYSHPIRFADVFDQLTWTDTAAILMNLDLVICVDTAVAHLAGALGRPVWTLLPYAPDWRWMLERTDTPWYPTMRLFRQPRFQDWSSVLHQVRMELQGVAVSTD